MMCLASAIASVTQSDPQPAKGKPNIPTKDSNDFLSMNKNSRHFTFYYFFYFQLKCLN